MASAQGINISPAAPVVNAGGTVTISADRPVLISLFGYGTLSSTTSTSTVYQAPSSLYPQHLLNGCMVGPNDSVFNMNISKLPVDPNSAAWTPFILSNGATVGFKWGMNLVNNATPMAAQQFQTTSQLNGTSFPAPPQTSQKRQNGAYTTDENVDHHMISLNTQTCQFYETNQQGIPLSQCPACTADSGWTYASTSYAMPSTTAGGGTTDSSGLPLAPLTVHVSEIWAGHISHALRFTACAACVGPQAKWPATASVGTQPGAPPVGTRFRLKSSFNVSGFPTAAQRVLVALQQYGMILTGPGVDGEISISTDVTEDAVSFQALQSLTGGALNSSDFEVVNEASYMLSPASTAVNPLNGYQYPVSFALLIVTDAANHKNSVELPIALQAAMVGTQQPSIVVQAGTPAFQIPNWVTGSSNQTVNWTISPSSGGGTISSTGLYTPPTSVNNPQNVTLNLVSAANTIPYATTSVGLTIIPSGAIRIDSGSTVATTDDRGLTWLPDVGSETGNYTVVNDASAQNAWSGVYNHAIWQTYKQTAGDDILYNFRVPNGTYAVQMMFGVGNCQGSFAGQGPGNGMLWGPLNLQSQSSVVDTNWDFGLPVNYQCQTPETASMLAQVTNNALAVAVRATGGDSQHTAALLNGLTITPVGSSAAADPTFTQNSSPGVTPTFNIQELDPNCGQAGYNCRAAFQNAFGLFAQAGGGTLTLPAGTFLVDFPELAENVSGAPWFTSSSLVAVPPNTLIQGDIAANGTLDSIIQYQITSVPVFVFSKASYSGMSNLHFNFIGVTPSQYPYGDIMLLSALGYATTYPHQNEISSSNGELSACAFVFDSDFTTFNNLIFDSANRDNNHVQGTSINLKGKGVILTGGGGLTTLAVGNQISNLQIYDFIGGLAVAGQNGVNITNISADRRGSTGSGAPGHLIYMTDTYQATDAGVAIASLQSTNISIQNVSEGPDTYSNANAGGTLAIKSINGGLVNNIKSQHPEGLIQTLYEDQNITFSNMTWQSSYDLCANVPNNCITPVIYSATNASQFSPLQNLTFNNVSLTSTITPVSVMLIGNGITVNGMNIQTPPTYLPNQTVGSSILSVKGTTQAAVTNYTYTPLITSYSPAIPYNIPFMAWDPSSNVQAQVTINWPSSIPVPSAGAAIISSGFQDANSNNSVSTNIVLQ